MRLFFLACWRRSESNGLWSCAKPFRKGLRGHKFGGRDRNARSEASNALGQRRGSRGSLLTVKKWIDEMNTPLSPASQRPSLRHFEQTVFPLAMSKWGSFSSVFLRFALGLSFLSAVADRFGLWGQFGQPNVAWGTFSRFVEYTGRLNSYLPPRMTLTLAVISTGAEILFGLLLLVGWHTRTAALLSGILLMAFGLAMALALGAKAPLDFSVFSAAGGALLLAGCERFPFSVDGLLLLRSR